MSWYTISDGQSTGHAAGDEVRGVGMSCRDLKKEASGKGRRMMSMTPRERILAVYNGEEPDKTPVLVPQGLLRRQPPGDWEHRLKERGIGFMRTARIFQPTLCTFREPLDARLADVRYTRTEYCEKGIWESRYTYETPVGSVTGVMVTNPPDYSVGRVAQHPKEYVVKQPSDWRVVNYFIRKALDNLAPTSHGAFQRAEEELGDGGITIAFLTEYTAWQRAWIWLAGPERSVVDFHEQPDEIQEYVDLHRRLHTRLAEFAAEFPARYVLLCDHITEVTSPGYYREYCLPIYEIYSKQLEGTGKILGVHMDGRFGQLKREIAESPINVIDSFSVPPIGDVSLSEARRLWPDKMMFMNPAAHMAWAEPEELREFYASLAAEWGSKKGLLLEHMEHLPTQTVGSHFSAVMDAFGY